MSAGVERVLFPPDGTSDLRRSGIVLTNNKIVQGPEIADHALAMLLMLSRDLYVLGVDPEDKPFLAFLERVVKPDEFDDVIPQADVIFLSVPDTPKSHKMMGTHEFELMKQNAYFIAVSRGGIYDVNGLVKALDKKRLAGARVDVTDPEPLPKGHALWKLAFGNLGFRYGDRNIAEL